MGGTNGRSERVKKEHMSDCSLENPTNTARNASGAWQRLLPSFIVSLMFFVFVFFAAHSQRNMKDSCIPSANNFKKKEDHRRPGEKKGHAETIVTGLEYARRNKAANSGLDIGRVLAPPAPSSSHCIRDISYFRARSSARAVDRLAACIALLAVLLSCSHVPVRRTFLTSSPFYPHCTLPLRCGAVGSGSGSGRHRSRWT